MGVDAVMEVHVTAPLTKEVVRKASVDMCTLFGAEKFMMTKPAINRHPDDFAYGGECHALTIQKTDHSTGVITVHLWTRYWGPHYERGDFPLIYTLSAWLEARFAPCGTVMYGGDSSDSLFPLDSDARKELIAHAVSDEANNYRTRTWPTMQGDPKAPHCAFCDRDFTQYMSGPKTAGFACHGCGTAKVTEDDGKTWKILSRREQ